MSVVALLGGTFDPPHLGHVGAARYVLERKLVSKVLVIPVFSHAFAKQPASPFDERLELCRLAFSELEQVEVSDLERQLSVPSYTITTVRALKERRPHESFRLLVGSDVVAELPRWHEAEALLRLCPPLVLERVGYPAPGALPAALPDISSSELRRSLRELGDPPYDTTAYRRLAQLMPAAVLKRALSEGHYRAGPKPTS